MDERKMQGTKLEEASSFAELLAQFSETEREKIHYLLLGMKISKECLVDNRNSA